MSKQKSAESAPSVAKKKKATKVQKPPREKKRGLRTPQLRILKALIEYKGADGLTRAEIAKKAKVSPSMTGNLGAIDPIDTEACEKRYGKRSLIGLGYVSMAIHEGGESYYKATKAGVKEYTSLKSKS